MAILDEKVSANSGDLNADFYSHLLHLKECQKIMYHALQERDKAEEKLREWEDLISDYFSEKFNKENKEVIKQYHCLLVNPDDVNVDWLSWSVSVSSEDPKTNHLYDRTYMVSTVEEVLKEINACAKI